MFRYADSVIDAVTKDGREARLVFGLNESRDGHSVCLASVYFPDTGEVRDQGLWDVTGPAKVETIINRIGRTDATNLTPNEVCR